jgi:hypothetical protein
MKNLKFYFLKKYCFFFIFKYKEKEDEEGGGSMMLDKRPCVE